MEAKRRNKVLARKIDELYIELHIDGNVNCKFL
jgi:hypothetical protein